LICALVRAREKRRREKNIMDLLTLVLLPFMLPGFSLGQSGQYFLTPPSNTSVVEGETARILCQVGSSAGRGHGRVQWTKSGLTLGYDRALPGFPRYSMLGEDSEGSYDLQIVNATIEDNDDYECQVGPGGGSPPIRSSAKLDVLLAPTDIEIMNHASGSRIEMRENTEVELICTVRDSKPAASIVWYRKGQRFNPSGSLGSVEDKVEDGSPNRKTVTSKIKFRPNSDDNQASYACEAVHPALKAGPMRVSVFLSVLYPPEPPEIQGYIEGETIRMGQSVTLVCESCGGNPLASIVWYKNNERIDHSYTTSGSKSKNTYMFVAAPDDNNAVYRCEAKNLMIIHPLTAEIRMSVQFAPDKVTIEGPKVAKVNETLNFECTTANSNPASSITWVVDGRTYPATHTRNDTSKGGGWITTSNMSINISATDRNKAISCYSNNYALGETIVGTHIVNVLYPPDDLSITGYKEGDKLKEGSLQRIKCTVLSGNPLPKLQWHKGKKKINSEIQEGVSGTYRSAEMSITARRQDNGKVYECRAKNEASSKALVKNVTLSVDFPPNFVNVTSDKNEPKEGELTTLKCVTDSSKPAAMISWWYNGTKLNATDTLIKAGKFGGSKTTSMLQINVTVEHVDAIFRCEAKHKETGSSVHNAIKLKVHYKPQFIDVKDKYEVEVGGSKILEIKSMAHPVPTKWVWKKKMEDGWKNIQTMNQALPNTHIAEMPNGSLNMTSVQKEDAGVYKILITNSVATSQATFDISILYPPSFVEITRSTLVNVGEDVVLNCNVDASPLKPNTIKWKRSKYDMSRVIKESTATGSKITIKNVTIDDAGMFTCIANNGIPKESPESIEENLYLLVKHKPIIDKSKALTKAASDSGFDGKLICKAKGAPNITFKWFRNGERINGGAEDSKKTKHVIRDEMEDYLNWKTELIVRRVDSSDYGAYECFAQNVMGDSRHEVVLDVKSHPDPPVGLQVQNVTYNSVYLTWEAGFDGGFPQMYRIRMLKDGADNFAYMDVFPTNATEFMLPDLQFGTTYGFNIMASNQLGSSNFTTEKVVATTLTAVTAGVKPSPSPPGSKGLGRGIIAAISIVGTLLVIINIILISCYVKRRTRKHLYGECFLFISTKCIFLCRPTAPWDSREDD